jgi:hypothetical protein
MVFGSEIRDVFQFSPCPHPAWQRQGRQEKPRPRMPVTAKVLWIGQIGHHRPVNPQGNGCGTKKARKRGAELAQEAGGDRFLPLALTADPV